jgi:hypothetical protein
LILSSKDGGSAQKNTWFTGQFAVCSREIHVNQKLWFDQQQCWWLTQTKHVQQATLF